MRTVLGGALLFLGVGLGACVGEAPIVGESADGTVGSGGSGPTGSTRYVFQPFQPWEEGAPSCLPMALGLDGSGRATCQLVASSMNEDGNYGEAESCDCARPGLAPASAGVKALILGELEQWGSCSDEPSDGQPECSKICLCEVLQAEGDAWQACETDPEPQEAPGWCYIEPARGVGSAALVAGCDGYGFRLRVTGGVMAEGQPGFVLCHASSTPPPALEAEPQPVGRPCLPSDEAYQDFGGYSEVEVTVSAEPNACTSGICVVNHLRGRVSCPYGQTAAEALTDPQCFVPGSDLAVTVPVAPQLVRQSAETHAVCSCRCDGPFPGSYCSCPSGTECVPLVQSIGQPSDAAVAGSYCLPTGTRYDPQAVDGSSCDRELENCGDPTRR